MHPRLFSKARSAVSSVHIASIRWMRGLMPSATVLRSLRSRTLPPPSNPLNRLTRSPAASSFFTTFRLPARGPVGSRVSLGAPRGSGGVKLGGNALLGGFSNASGRTTQGTPTRWIRSFHSSRTARDVFFVSTSSVRSFDGFDAFEFALTSVVVVVAFVQPFQRSSRRYCSSRGLLSSPCR